MGELGRRERKITATRQAIRDTALRLFRERGFADTTVRAITDEVDVAERTFFRYFASKEAVLFDSDDHLIPGLLAALDTRPPGEPLLASITHALAGLPDMSKTSRALFAWRAELAAEHPSVAAYSRELYQQKVEDFAQVIATRLGTDPDVDMRPRLLAQTTSAVVDVALREWLRKGSKSSLPELIESAYAQLDEVLWESREHTTEESA